MEAAVVRPTPIGFHLFSTIPTQREHQKAAGAAEAAEAAR